MAITAEHLTALQNGEQIIDQYGETWKVTFKEIRTDGWWLLGLKPKSRIQQTLWFDPGQNALVNLTDHKIAPEFQGCARIAES